MSSSYRRMSRAPRPAALTVTAALMFVSLTACGGETQEVREDEGWACTDSNGVVVDDDYCDDDERSGGGVYFFHSYPFSSSRPAVGTKLTGGTTVRTTDTAARANAGLPKSGVVKSGTKTTKVTTKSGGLGTGSSGKSSGRSGGSFGG